MCLNTFFIWDMLNYICSTKFDRVKFKNVMTKRSVQKQISTEQVKQPDVTGILKKVLVICTVIFYYLFN